MDYSLTTQMLLEFIATFVLILLGDGVVACVSLNKSKGQNAGWVVITIAWGLAVWAGILISGPYSGAHLNPAVTIAFAAQAPAKWPIAKVLGYIVAQLAGAFLGAVVVYVFYKKHFDATDDANAKLGVFCTGPAIRSYGYNLFSEIIGTFVLVFAIFATIVPGNEGLSAVGPLPVTYIIVVIGMALGGTTGYAINPARDLGPRLAHAVLPIKGKRDSDWAYSWVPVVGPILGGLLAYGAYVVFYGEILAK